MGVDVPRAAPARAHRPGDVNARQRQRGDRHAMHHGSRKVAEGRASGELTGDVLGSGEVACRLCEGFTIALVQVSATPQPGELTGSHHHLQMLTRRAALAELGRPPPPEISFVPAVAAEGVDDAVIHGETVIEFQRHRYYWAPDVDNATVLSAVWTIPAGSPSPRHQNLYERRPVGRTMPGHTYGSAVIRVPRPSYGCPGRHTGASAVIRVPRPSYGWPWTRDVVDAQPPYGATIQAVTSGGSIPSGLRSAEAISTSPAGSVTGAEPRFATTDTSPLV